MSLPAPAAIIMDCTHRTDGVRPLRSLATATLIAMAPAESELAARKSCSIGVRYRPPHLTALLATERPYLRCEVKCHHSR